MLQGISGAYWVLQKKSAPGIVFRETGRTIRDVEEYIRKIKFYLPDMSRLYENGDVDYYPRRILYAFNSPCGLCEYRSLCIEGDLSGYIIGYSAIEAGHGKLFVSPSDVIKYETCPRQWAYYKSGVKSPFSSAASECGSCLHKGIEEFLLNGDDPVRVFEQEWMERKDAATITYNQKDTHQGLLEIGMKLMSQFPDKWRETGLEVCNVERTVRIDLGDFCLKGRPDIVATKDCNLYVIDWKFTAVSFSDDWVAKSDQMTAYAALLFLSEEVFA